MSKRPPKYGLHKPSGQARVTLNGRTIYLGRHGSPESRQRYADLITDYQAGSFSLDRELMTLDRLAIEYTRHAETYYVKDGKPTRELSSIQSALRPLLARFGTTRVRDFGPARLKVVREDMIELFSMIAGAGF